MPQINRLQKKEKQKKVSTAKEVRAKAYNDSKWKKLRKSHLEMNPLCCDCLKKGKIVPAEDVHHDKSPFKNEEVDYSLFYDNNNLVSLCKKCHSERHLAEKNQISATKMVAILDELLREESDIVEEEEEDEDSRDYK